MGLNPSYYSQQPKPLPVGFGYVYGGGYEALVITAQDGTSTGTQYGLYLLLEGENDGLDQMARVATDHLRSPGGPTTITSTYFGIPDYAHFHAGTWTPIGINSAAATSIGPDQAVDSWYSKFPTIIPELSFSGICYVLVSLGPGNVPRGIIGGQITSVAPLAICGVIRASRCRYFDESGNVTGYGFTTNPTWHIIEAILRYKIKTQQPQIAGLTQAEKDRFNWPAIVAHAERNDFVLTNGFPRFMSNCLFASDGSLASILETLLRCCRSYLLEDSAGRIGLYGFDAVDSSFKLTDTHIVPGTFKAAKKNIAGAPNIFVPMYRDLNVPALVKVDTASNTTTGGGTIIFSIEGTTPFAKDQAVIYGDSDNPALHFDYIVIPETTPGARVKAKGFNSTLTATGGYLGTQDSRFQERAPNTVQHRRHQKAASQVAPGIAVQPRQNPVTYDLGNMTYDQANRLMKYELNSTLGNDVDGWQPPITGSVTIRLTAIDVDGNAAFKLRPGMSVSVDDLVSPEFAGEYLIDPKGVMTINGPTASDPLGSIELPLYQYNPDAFTDESDPPDDAYRTIATAKLPNLGVSLQMTNVAWTLVASPTVTDAGDGTVTVAIANLVMQILGRVGTTAYPTASWAGLTPGSQYILYVDDDGTTVSFGKQSGLLPLTSPPATRYAVLAGTFAVGTTDAYAPNYAELTV
ncbi:MAG TPA: hypothetical protein VGN16_21220 [Acidobacteriaceae bacterium]|jgi:hypothetical protein